MSVHNLKVIGRDEGNRQTIANRRDACLEGLRMTAEEVTQHAEEGCDVGAVVMMVTRSRNADDTGLSYSYHYRRCGLSANNQATPILQMELAKQDILSEFTAGD